MLKSVDIALCYCGAVLAAFVCRDCTFANEILEESRWYLTDRAFLSGQYQQLWYLIHMPEPVRRPTDALTTVVCSTNLNT